MGADENSRTLQLLVNENHHLLQQGIDLIGTLSESTYSLNKHELFSSGVGKHFRHILDFYDRLFAGEEGLIDYDARARDPRVESDPSYAVDRARSAMERLDGLITGGDAGRVTVRVETRAPDGVGLLTESSIGRELAQLASHTIHHYAIIALVLSIQGVAVPSGFGIAPSTLRHEHRLGQS